MLITIIGYCAAFLTTLSFLPQAIKTVKTRDTESISLFMYILFTIGLLLWLVYGAATKQYSIVAANSVTVCFTLLILGFKIAGLQKNKK